MAEEDPFKAAVACLKAGAAADKQASSDRAQLVLAVRSYRAGLQSIDDAAASGRYKPEVIEALQKKEKVVKGRLAGLEPKLTPEERAELDPSPANGGGGDAAGQQQAEAAAEEPSGAADEGDSAEAEQAEQKRIAEAEAAAAVDAEAAEAALRAEQAAAAAAAADAEAAALRAEQERVAEAKAAEEAARAAEPEDYVEALRTWLDGHGLPPHNAERLAVAFTNAFGEGSESEWVNTLDSMQPEELEEFMATIVDPVAEGSAPESAAQENAAKIAMDRQQDVEANAAEEAARAAEAQAAETAEQERIAAAKAAEEAAAAAQAEERKAAAEAQAAEAEAAQTAADAKEQQAAVSAAAAAARQAAREAEAQAATAAAARAPPKPFGGSASSIDYESMRPYQLKALCKQRGLDQSGTQAALIERLRNAPATAQQRKPEPEPEPEQRPLMVAVAEDEPANLEEETLLSASPKLGQIRSDEDSTSPGRESLLQQQIVTAQKPQLMLPMGGVAATPGTLQQRRPSIAVAAMNSKGSRQAFLDMERMIAMQKKAQEAEEAAIAEGTSRRGNGGSGPAGHGQSQVRARSASDPAGMTSNLSTPLAPVIGQQTGQRQSHVHGRPVGAYSGTADGQPTNAEDLVSVLRTRGFQGDLSPKTRASVATLTTQLQEISIDELAAMAKSSDHPVYGMTQRDGDQQLTRTLSDSDDPKGTLINLMVAHHAIKSEAQQQAEAVTAEEAHATATDSVSMGAAVPGSAAGAASGSTPRAGLDLSLVEEAEEEEDERDDSVYDPGGSAASDFSVRSDSSTLNLLGGLDVSAMETPRLTPAPLQRQQQQQQRQRQQWRQQGANDRGAEVVDMHAHQEEAVAALDEERRQRQLERQVRDREMLRIREQEREEQRAALHTLVRSQPQQSAYGGADGDERRRRAMAEWEASEAEISARMSALRDSQRRAADHASLGATQAAEAAAEEETQMLAQRRVAIGLQAPLTPGGTVDDSRAHAPRLRVTGLPPAAICAGEGAADPFSWLHRPLVAAAAGLAVPATRNPAAAAVLGHLGERLRSGGEEEDDDKETCPVFGVLALAQGQLSDALIRWAGTAEAEAAVSASSKQLPEASKAARVALGEVFVSQAAAAAAAAASTDRGRDAQRNSTAVVEQPRRPAATRPPDAAMDPFQQARGIGHAKLVGMRRKGLTGDMEEEEEEEEEEDETSPPLARMGSLVPSSPEGDEDDDAVSTAAVPLTAGHGYERTGAGEEDRGVAVGVTMI
jgi:hypothetical protein